ncbi:OadG family transporter subunit [Paraglaciecola aquimarina]|uniref:Probable oxaloacetate decarboxylase gamma chain n=1 Tax=Paraglaciecola aquimarina TaxID=1235557 RepID=A0ABU3T0B1_9ALTE|nr:OadG family transporter subunit [Paraglaciecola aquimarina]MDU0355652.1 OadG family transporter subunit [Paraglaciecola aquimarina]
MQPDVAHALAEAANLLFVGMAVVFLFLTMLIGAVNLIAWLNRLFPEETINPGTGPQSFSQSPATNSQNVSPKVVAAITTAIREHRRSH